MNKFTKEELKDLLYALDCCHRTPVGVKSPPLMLKIQSMIENYCEHEWRSSAIDAIYCPHCQKHVECAL